MLYVNNVAYLNLAKVDFNQCQHIHQLKWLGIQRWYNKCRLKVYGMVKEDMLKTYFLAAISIFEPEQATERLNWARTAMLAEAIIASYHCTTSKVKLSFTGDFSINRQNLWLELNQREEPVDCILGMFGFLVATPDIYGNLRRAWVEWLSKLNEGEDQERGLLIQGATALLFLRTIEFCAGRTEPIGEVARMEYAFLTRLAISISNRLQFCSWVTEGNMIRKCNDRDIESEMQELVKCVIEQPQSPNDLSRETKQICMAVVKNFYYLAGCPSTTQQPHLKSAL